MYHLIHKYWNEFIKPFIATHGNCSTSRIVAPLFQNYSNFYIIWLGIWFQGPYFDGKNIPHSPSKFITTSEICGFSIGFGRKYQPITVSVSVSCLNQNSGFGRSLVEARTDNRNQVHIHYLRTPQVFPHISTYSHIFPNYLWGCDCP